MKFKVGDRVAVYEVRRRLIGVVEENPNTGPSWVNTVWVNLGGGRKEHFNPKQCRLLKKKERRRVWVDPDYLIPNQPYFYKPEKGMPVRTTKGNSWIEFIEVKRKSIVTGDK